MSKSIAGYQYLVVTRTDAAETKTWLVPMGMCIRDALREMFGNPQDWPPGRLEISVPETLPFNPDTDGASAQTQKEEGK